VRASLGIAVALANNIYLKVAPVCTIGVLDITNSKYKNKAYIDVLRNYKSYEPTKIFSYGLNVGVAFNL